MVKRRSQIGSRITVAAAGALAIALSVSAVLARADVWDKKTVLSVHQPIQVQDTYLEPGTYVMKLHNSSSNRHIVQIYNREENRLINTIMAIPSYRMRPTDGSQFTFYETPAGTARAMRTWYYPGETYGQEFRYPKQLREIAMTMPSPQFAERPPEPPPPPIVTQPEEPQREPEPEPQAAVEPPKREEPELIAQNREQPAVEPAPAPASAQPKAEEPAELPETATSYPLIGFGGLLSLAAFSLLRINGTR